MPARLTRDQKQFFDDNGYLLLEQVYSPEEMAEAREQMNALLRDPTLAHPRVGFSYESPGEESPFCADNPHRVWMVMDTPLAGDWWFRQFQEPFVVDAVM